ncbi:MAG TPA: radical SAM protein [Anaeromyxobacter sp.]
MAERVREPSYGERLAHRDERLHVGIGAACNNHCLFCMERNRTARAAVNGAMTPERVRWVLERARGAEEVCFTSGEPTTRRELPTFVAWARELGYPRVSLMTNGRRLAYAPYAAALLRAGLNRIYVSIHGHEARLHEGLTRAPGSFAQTVAGLRVVASLKRPGDQLHTSTVVNARNLPHLAEIYRFLRGLGVDQAVFNAMRPPEEGVPATFRSLWPRYRDVAAAFARLCREAGEPRPPAFLVDVPPCVTGDVPDFNRGFVERHRRYEPGGAPASDLGVRLVPPGESREKRPACGACRWEPLCDGVWRDYVSRHGWEEFEPVAAEGERAR